MKGIEAKKQAPADPLSLIFFLNLSKSHLNPSNEGEQPPFFSISFLPPHVTNIVGPQDRSAFEPPAR